MATYVANRAAGKQARLRINDAKVDTSTGWSDAAPSTDDGMDVFDAKGYDGSRRGTSPSTPTPRRT